MEGKQHPVGKGGFLSGCVRSEIPSPLPASPVSSKQEGCVRMVVFGAVCWQKSDNPWFSRGMVLVALIPRNPAWDSATQNEKRKLGRVDSVCSDQGKCWLTSPIYPLNLSISTQMFVLKSYALGEQSTVPVPGVLSFRGLLPFSL